MAKSPNERCKEGYVNRLLRVQSQSESEFPLANS
jgi:hypothetical protein